MKNEVKNLDSMVRLNPYFITGFADGESNFTVSICKDSERKLGWRVRVAFQIGLDSKDKGLLDRIQAYFGVGKVYRGEKNIYRFKVQSSKDLQIILEHFDKYPLLTKKRADFELFKQIVEIMKRKDLTPSDLQEIVNIRASINNGLSEELKAAFPNAKPAPRPEVEVKDIPDPH